MSPDPAEGVKRLPEQKAAPKWLGRRELGALMRAVQKLREQERSGFDGSPAAHRSAGVGGGIPGCG